MSSPDVSLVYIVILNTNGWRDTLECLESVFRLDHPRFRAVVCDNGSPDGSMEKICAWARGELESGSSDDPRLQQLVRPPVDKPVPYRRYDWRAAGAGRLARDWDAALDEATGDEDSPLILIQNGGNLGFGAGNNTGLRYALSRGDLDCAWLLNNDTVVEPPALSELVRVLEATPGAGFCGSTVRFYGEPDTIQTHGGSVYNRWLATQDHVGSHRPVSRPLDPAEVVRRMDYVYGASVLVTRDLLEQIGLLCEDYFLYFDEIDWAARARGRFGLAYAPDSVVYHKEGATVDARGRGGAKSKLADYHAVANRLVYTRRFHPLCLPTVYAGFAAVLVNRVRRRQWDRLLPVVQLALGKPPKELLDADQG